MSLLTELQAVGLPVISVSPANEITMGDMTEDQKRLYRAVLLHHFSPFDFPDIVQVVQYRLDLQNNYLDIIAHLLSYSNWNNASLPELRTQMKYISSLLYKIMRAMENPIRNVED
jgi:hypothetical protein